MLQTDHNDRCYKDNGEKCISHIKNTKINIFYFFSYYVSGSDFTAIVHRDELLFSTSSYTMLDSVKGYIYERRNGITTAVTFVGGFYLAKHYIQDRLDEVKVKLEQERAAQDRYDNTYVPYPKAYNPIPSSLRRRFQQTQEDVSYTISALIPTLSEQVLDQMDIEALTQELQNRSKARNAARIQLQAESSSLASSVVDLVHEQDTRSDVESAASHTSTSFDEVNASSSMSHSALQSWVESSGSRSPAPSIADSSAASSTSEVHLSESVRSASGVRSVNESGMVCILIFKRENLRLMSLRSVREYT